MINVCDGRVIIENELSAYDISLILSDNSIDKISQVYISRDLILDFKTVDAILTFFPKLTEIVVYLPAGLENQRVTYRPNELTNVQFNVDFLNDNSVTTSFSHHFYDIGEKVDFNTINTASNLINFFVEQINRKTRDGKDFLSPLEKYLYAYYLTVNCQSNFLENSREVGFLTEFKSDFDEFEYLTKDSVTSLDMAKITHIGKNAYTSMLCELCNLSNIPSFVHGVIGIAKPGREIEADSESNTYSMPICQVYLNDSRYKIKDGIYLASPILDVGLFGNSTTFTYSLIIPNEVEDIFNSSIYYFNTLYNYEDIKNLLVSSNNIDDLQNFLSDDDFIREFLKTVYAVVSLDKNNNLDDKFVKNWFEVNQDEVFGLQTNNISKLIVNEVRNYCFGHRSADVACRYGDIVFDEGFIKKLINLFFDKKNIDKEQVFNVLQNREYFLFEDEVINLYKQYLNNANFINASQTFLRLQQNTTNLSLKQISMALNSVFNVDSLNVKGKDGKMGGIANVMSYIDSSIQKARDSFDGKETENPFDK